MIIYAMSDIHGCWDAFEHALEKVDLTRPNNRLILLGDYIDHERRHPEVYVQLQALQAAHPGQIIALKGNHDAAYLEKCRLAASAVGSGGVEGGPESRAANPLDAATRRWIKHLPLYYETDRQIFVHAGIDETAGDLWKYGSEDWFFYEKFPAVFGPFEKDIVAGHIGTVGMCGEHRVFWDGEAHYYLDGSTEQSGMVPVLAYHTQTGAYTTFERIDTPDGPRWGREVPITAGRTAKR